MFAGWACLAGGLGEIERPIAGQLSWLLAAGERGKGGVEIELAAMLARWRV